MGLGMFAQESIRRIVRGIVSSILFVFPFCLTAAPHQDEPADSPSSVTGSLEPRASIEERGIHPFAILKSEGWGNVSGGTRRGAYYNHLLDFGAELDTAQLGWWEGGMFIAHVHWVDHAGSEDRFDAYTGTFNPASAIMASDQLRVFNLHYRHAWPEDAVVIKIGQIAADDDFMGSEYSSLFLNSALGAMPSQTGTPLASSLANMPAFPIFSVASPGVFVSVRLSEAFSTQLGLYHGRPGLDEPDNHGFDWAHEPLELALFWENAYTFEVAERAAALRFGLSYHTGPFDDFRLVTSDGDPDHSSDWPNFYAIHDLQLIANEDGSAKLGFFARAGFAPEPELNVVDFYADTGLNWFAPFSSRKDDVAGVALSYTRFGDHFRRSLGPGSISTHETMVELTYRAQLAAWFVLQADAQFVFDPAFSVGPGSRDTAAIIGLRAEVSF